MACIAGCDKPCSAACLRRSINARCGASAAPGRFGSNSFEYRPWADILEGFEDGVAEPSTIGTCARWARHTARSRAE